MRHDLSAQPLLPQTLQPVSWRRVLFIGSLLYATGIIVLLLTSNPNLFPMVVMLGTFLVPVTYVVYIFQHRSLSQLSITTTAMCFFYGGILGGFASALLEPMFIREHQLSQVGALQVGLIEEAAKILGVLVIARRSRHTSELNGLILGAAAGMGFAAIESNGYAFTAFLTSRGDLGLTFAVTLFRGVLAPLGHGTWTAILAAVLFRESRVRRFRFDAQVVGAYLLVSVLHGLWNALPGTLPLLGFSFSNILTGQFIVGTVGIVILLRLWHQALRRQLTALEIAQPSAEDGETDVA